MTSVPRTRTVRAVLRDLCRDGRGPVLLFVAAGWFFSLGVRLAYPTLLPYVRAEFGLGLTAAGLLITTLWTAYALGQFPGGILRDRLGDRAVLTASTALSAVTLLAVALSRTAPTLFAATMLFGFGTALFGTARFTVLADIYEDREGVAIGITMAAGNVGNVVLPVAATLIATALAWRVGLGLAVPFFAVFALGLWRVVPGRTVEAGGALSAHTLARICSGVTRRPVIVATGALLLVHFAWQGFTGFYPTYLVERKGLDPNVTAAVYGLFFASGIVVQPVAGAGSDRYGPRPTLLAAIGAAVVALAVLPFAGSLPALAALTVLASSVLGVVPVGNAYLVAALPADVEGGGLGLVRTVYIMGGAAGPVLVGAVADRGLFDLAFPLLAAAAVVAIGLVLRLPPEAA